MTHKFNPPKLVDWAAEVRQEEAPEWLIESFLPADNLVLISGQPKDSKKTWLGMWLALRVAHAGYNVTFCYREGARKKTLERFDALLSGLGLSDKVYERIYFAHRGSFFLDDQAQIDTTVKFVKQHDIRFFVVDTFAKSVQSDENSSKDMGKAISAAERIRNAGATVCLTHHIRKSTSALSNGNIGAPEPDKDLRGSSALAGAYETHLAIRSYQGKPALLLVGGKEFEWTAYKYNWTFAAGPDKVLKDARVQLVPTDMPSIGDEEE